MSETSLHVTVRLAEADRLMTICNSCRYCEGLCAVFPAMEMRRSFADSDLNYLANLCHACGACYIDCQFSPPHQFDVNVPKVLAEVRNDSYAAYAWPRALAGLFERNLAATLVVAAVCIAAFVAGFLALDSRQSLFGADASPGRFYALMPHAAMALLFGAAFGYAAVALVMEARNFWRDMGRGAKGIGEPALLWGAIKDAASLRYLDGGQAGCFSAEEKPNDPRRLFHHLTFYGFVLCFASTSVASLYHYLLRREAPYAWSDLPVILGGVGGLGLVIGPAGLMWSKLTRDRTLVDARRLDMDFAFVAVLLAAGATGLLLLVFRAAPAMGLLLALHLGVILALALTMPYGKFVHGLYRFVALARYAHERRGL